MSEDGKIFLAGILGAIFLFGSIIWGAYFVQIHELAFEERMAQAGYEKVRTDDTKMEWRKRHDAAPAEAEK